jgi:hypothetical protein
VRADLGRSGGGAFARRGGIGQHEIGSGLARLAALKIARLSLRSAFSQLPI